MLSKKQQKLMRISPCLGKASSNMNNKRKEHGRTIPLYTVVDFIYTRKTFSQ